MKRELIVLIFGALLLLSLIFVMAEDNATSNDSVVNSVNASARPFIGGVNLTYGRCVSELAKTENTCLRSVNNASKVCDQSSVKSRNASVVKTCKTTFKQAQDKCKTIYKENKVSCNQYKKTFWDRVRFWR